MASYSFLSFLAISLILVMLVNTNDYLVADSMMSTIGGSIILNLTGGDPIELSGTEYLTSHLLIDAAYLVVLLLSILPLIFIKRWFSKLKRGKKTNNVITGSLLHLVYPTLLLLLPTILGIPYFVIRGFVPDLFLILIISIFIAYATGIVKVILAWTNRVRV